MLWLGRMKKITLNNGLMNSILWFNSFLHRKDHESQLHCDDIICCLIFWDFDVIRFICKTCLQQPILTNQKKKPYFPSLQVSHWPQMFSTLAAAHKSRMAFCSITMWSESIPNVMDVREVGGKQKQGGTFEISENIFKSVFGSSGRLPWKGVEVCLGKHSDCHTVIKKSIQQR